MLMSVQEYWCSRHLHGLKIDTDVNTNREREMNTPTQPHTTQWNNKCGPWGFRKRRRRAAGNSKDFKERTMGLRH